MSEIDGTAKMDQQSRMNLMIALKRITEVQQVVIAAALELSPATVSRFVSDDLPRACAVLAAVGIKLVPVEAAIYDPKKVDILLRLARDHLNSVDSVEQFKWD